MYITDYAYTADQVLVMETAMLTRLAYNICIPTGYHFLARYLDSISASERTRSLAHYYAERNMQEYDSLKYKPHVFAAACVYLSLKQQVQHVLADSAAATGESCWSQTLKEESGLCEPDLLCCAKTIIRHVKEEPETASKRRLNAVRKKYPLISTLPLPSIIA